MNKNIILAFPLAAVAMISACSSQKQTFISPEAWAKAVNQVDNKYGLEVSDSLKPDFQKAKVNYPPKKISLLAFKKEQRIELWAFNKESQWQYIKKYPLTAYSGTLGPKLKRNDGQIPEGIYKITQFNPFSSQHLSLMLNYPNQWDKNKAREEKRSDLGDNIFIHGKEKSVGCLAIGDQAINELFVLTHEVGKENTRIIISPTDLRKTTPLTLNKNSPKWTKSLYMKIKNKLKKYVYTYPT